MRILGIDPGIGRMGWAVVDVIKGKVVPIAYSCLETSKDHAISDRLQEVFSTVVQLIAEHKPDALVTEELFFNTNVTTAFTVGQARGVIMLAAAQQNLAIASYTPPQIKMAVTGYGKADKKQVGQMVKAILKLQHVPKLDDTADALAVAITHAFSAKFPSK